MCKACGYMMSHEQPGAGAEVVSLEAVREKNNRFICRTIFFVSVLVWLCMVLLYPLVTLCSDCFMAFFSIPEVKGENV
jgi:uncharacterized protein (DUF983 family)